MKSKIENVLLALAGTEECEILKEMEAAYARIEQAQTEWYKATNWTCPNSCGRCCEHFEPDLMEGEALYLAAWLIEHQPKIAEAVANGQFPYDNSDGCPFFNPDSPYHCSVYEGRAFICRLFGAGCSRNKQGVQVWRPCRFYSAEMLARHNPPIEHREYRGEEIRQILGQIPPVMSDMTDEALEFTPDNETTLLVREVCPKAIKRLLFILELEQDKDADNT